MHTPKTSAAVTSEDLVHISLLLNKFAWIADIGDVDAFNALFHPDAIWTMEQQRWEGRTAIVTGLASMRTAGYAGPESGTRHLITNIDIDTSSAEVRARSIFCLCSGGQNPVLRGMGTYTDVLVSAEQGWVLQNREVHML